MKFAQNSELRTQNSELRTQKSELRTQNSELRAQNSELRTQNPELKIKIVFNIIHVKLHSEIEFKLLRNNINDTIFSQ